MSTWKDEEGYGDTLSIVGQVNIVDGRAYIEACTLDHYFRDLDGKVVGFEIVLGLKQFENYPPIDAKIAPLVNALRARGVRTLYSCEGHLTPRGNLSSPYPQVDFPAKDAVNLWRLPNGWTLEPGPFGDPEVVRLRPLKDAGTEAELMKMQDEAQKFAEALA